MGYRHDVVPMMQRVSHSTRAYIVNAEGLPSFVIPFDIMKHLKVADKAGQLDHARRVQLIDLDALQSELEIKLNE